MGAGYFSVWTLFGIAAFPVGVALATIEMRSPALSHAVPVAVGIIILFAGSLQFTAWKAFHLACCGTAPACAAALSADSAVAWRHGLRLGLHCSQCCAGQMAILLATGVMDLRAMAIVTVAITAERLVPTGARVARVMGAITIGVGLSMIVRAVALG